MGILEKIAEIEKEISRTQKNKGKLEDCIDRNQIIMHLYRNDVDGQQPRSIIWDSWKLNLPNTGPSYWSRKGRREKR